MQQLSTSTNYGSTRIQHDNVGSKANAQKLTTNPVPSMWRLLILPNRLSPTGIATDSALRLRLDAAHGVAPSLGEFSWRADIGLSTAFDSASCSQFDCCSATPVSVAPTRIASEVVPVQPIRQTQLMQPEQDQPKESSACGDRYRAMLAEAAHDIRAPLGVARQILSRIASRVRQDGGLSTQEIRLLDSANDRLQQATTWVDGILLPNRLEKQEAGTMRQRFYPHQLRGIVEPMVSAMARDRNIELDWVGWDRSLPRLYLDSNQLGRVLLNLISNAIAASARGSRLSLRIAWQTNVTQRLVIAVEDEGCGISAPMLRFINSAQPMPAPAEAGIGLVTVKSLMNAIGGSISAQVGPLGGTLFRITVPVDNRLSLVRGWLIQQSQNAARQALGNKGVGGSNAVKKKSTIQLHVLRSVDADTALVDQWLQQAAAAEDFVYRVSGDRWLWLSINGKASQVATAAATAASHCASLSQEHHAKVNCQLAAEWMNVDLQALHSAENQRNLLPQLSATIADKFACLAGNRVPPINDLKSALNSNSKLRSRQRDLLRVDETSSFAPKAKMRSADYLRYASSHSQPAGFQRSDFESADSGSSRVDLLTADPAIFAELAQDWRMQNSQL